MSNIRERSFMAAVLDKYHARTGDSRFSRAAGALRGGKAGHPRIDDSAALRHARTLLATGLATSKRQAMMRAASLFADGEDAQEKLFWRGLKKLAKGSDK